MVSKEQERNSKVFRLEVPVMDSEDAAALLSVLIGEGFAPNYFTLDVSDEEYQAKIREGMSGVALTYNPRAAA
ncbi:hypothetical protein [Phytoactinopolyspora halophila]|uniref:hypothetical protein n=1 Tax=Phytoactinopolyspora halophila TaxID=1981511 RepID=UPI000F4D6112|nr:hypothetical protein [Phytoactinopolyspora halophila]